MAKPKGLGKPNLGERGAKLGVYGVYGTGKTELIMSATRLAHLLLVDAEGRSQYYDPEENHGFEVVYSKNVKDALDLLAYAEELHRKGERVVFAIDGFSSMWFEQQEVAERIGSTSAGTAKYQSWGAAKKPLKKLYAQLYETPVDCMVTMRSKPKYEQETSGKVKDLGYNAPDTERGINYAVDLVVELHKDELPPGTPLKPDNFWAVVVKTSGPKQGNPLPIGTKIKDPSFEKLVALRLSGNGGGRIAGAEIDTQVALAAISTWKQFYPLAVVHLKYADEEAVQEAIKVVYGGDKQALQQASFEDVWALLQQHKEASMQPAE